jgi:hypothetical protein
MELLTKLSIAECRTRLASATDLKGLALSWDAEGPGPVVGEFRGQVFRLHTKKYYSNSFTPFFYGKLTEAEGGTRVEGVFRMHPIIRLFMVFWFAFLVLFTVGAIMVPPPANPALSAGRSWFFAGVALLAVLGAGLVLIGAWLGRGEKEVIRSFLATTLEAKDE